MPSTFNPPTSFVSRSAAEPNAFAICGHSIPLVEHLCEVGASLSVWIQASIGKAHLQAMGIRPWRECQEGVPDWLIASILESYYGGRAECGIRMVPVPGVLVDHRVQAAQRSLERNGETVSL